MTGKIYTTTDIAGILGVHQVTVTRWVNSGKLKSLLTLGGHKRIKEKDLVSFFRENDLPVPEELELPSETVKVLVVEDDEPVLNVLTEGIRRSGDEFDVYTAANGFEAGQKFNELLPEFVVLDIFLPGMDGFQVCRMIKEKKANTRVIAITGHHSEDVMTRILEAGADKYLQKPFETEQLIKEIETFIPKAVQPRV